MVYLIGLATALSTFLGGVFALKYKDKLHLILSFSAGAVIGVAFFDLLPESMDLMSGMYSSRVVTAIAAIGFASFMLLDRLTVFHGHSEEECHNPYHRGKLGASSLVLHSFLDGAIIGLSFKVSTSVGIIVTSAVLVHDFSDGINTVGLILKNSGKNKDATKWLVLDAIAPLVGIIITQFITLSQTVLGIILSLFCGFFIYLGASDLLPESHHGHSTALNTLLTISGMLILFIAITLAG